ncbi:MAG TPA: TMEM175 family protein [Ruania sp.]|nr:TMEM175 family protein [Ruania sp.]
MTETFSGHGTQEPPGEPRSLQATSARYGAFTDAVVAIAMTLLILPLMELVPEAAEQHLTAGRLLVEHEGQFLAFGLSFVLIGMFWFIHHRVFRADTPHDGRRAVVNLAWMATIVFLPVVTAMTGSSMPTDRVMIALYIGTLALSSWLLLVLTGLELTGRRRAKLVTPDRTLLAAPLAMSLLFTLALALAELAPQVSYFFLFLMVLTGPLRRLLIRFGVRDREGGVGMVEQ